MSCSLLVLQAFFLHLTALALLIHAAPDPVLLGKYLRLSEIMYSPFLPTTTERAMGYGGPEQFQFFELAHTGSAQDGNVTLDLDGLQISGAISATLPICT